MTEAPNVAFARLSADFAALSAQMARVSADLVALERTLSAVPAYSPPPPVYPAYPQQYSPPPPPAPKTPRNGDWIGKVLAVAGVAVTLIGVVLLLVLAAQAGVLRPEVRVAAGALLAAALVAVAMRIFPRPGGRVGAIALAATGVAAGYIDVIAVTTVYQWVPAPVGLVLAAVLGGGGLTLARRWNAQQLGVLVFVPLLVLAPVVVGRIDLLLIGFMLALAAASLPVQLGRDWIWLHSARTAASSLPLLLALIVVAFDDGRDLALAAACGVGAVLAIVGALVLLPGTRNRVAMALLTGAGVAPALCVDLAADRAVAAAMAVALAVTLLWLVLVGRRWPGVDLVVRLIWAVLAAISATVAVLVAFEGRIGGPVLLAMAIAVMVGGREIAVARVIAVGFAAIGSLFYLTYAPPSVLVAADRPLVATGLSVLVASVLLIAFAVASVWAFARQPVAWVAAAAVVLYAVTTFTVTAGVLVGGEERGFLAGHMAATICWIATAAGLFGYAFRAVRSARSLFIGGGLALVAAAMAKLFLFDLGTLDGMFRVVVFIVVGLALLGMGAGYARLLERQDQRENVTANTG